MAAGSSAGPSPQRFPSTDSQSTPFLFRSGDIILIRCSHSQHPSPHRGSTSPLTRQRARRSALLRPPLRPLPLPTGGQAPPCRPCSGDIILIRSCRSQLTRSRRTRPASVRRWRLAAGPQETGSGESGARELFHRLRRVSLPHLIEGPSRRGGPTGVRARKAQETPLAVQESPRKGHGLAKKRTKNRLDGT